MARTQVATDNFNRAGPALGSDWTQWYPAWGFAVIGASTVFTGPGGVLMGAHWTGAGSFGDDQYCKVTLAGTVAFTNNAVAAGVRMQGSDSTRSGYFAQCLDNNDPNRTFRILKVLDGTQTVLSTVSRAMASGDTIAIEATGTSTVTLTAWHNDVQVTALDITDSSSPLTGGKPGICITETNPTADDFDAGTVGAAATTSLPPHLLQQPSRNNRLSRLLRFRERAPSVSRGGILLPPGLLVPA